MFNINQFRESIVQSTLKDLLMYAPESEELIVFTCAAESLGGTYIRQVDGPALGIYQMEPETYTDIWQNFIKQQGGLCMMMFSCFHISYMPSPERMIYDLRFATAMARLHYRRVAEPLPSVNDTGGLWSYYKRHYNTLKGKAEKEDSIEKYHAFVQR